MSTIRNNFNHDHRAVSSTFLHGITPFMVKNIVPNTTITANNKYFINLEPGSSQILANMTAHILHVFVPLKQIYSEVGLFYQGSGATSWPFKNKDLNLNTDKTKVLYYLLPQSSAQRLLDINYIPTRAYQKTIFDIFMRKYFQTVGIDVNTENFYQTTEGADTTTLETLAFCPYEGDYLNEIVSDIYYGAAATEVTSPFTWEDLKAALTLDNFHMLQKKCGVRIQDFIDKLFGVERKSQDAVEIVNYYQTKLNVNDIVNTDTNQGEIVSKAYGITPSVQFNYTSKEFGVLLGLYYVTTPDFVYSQGVPKVMQQQGYGNFYGLFHPEVQGLAFDTISKLYFDVNHATYGDPIGVTELYNDLRRSHNFAGAEYAREALRGNYLPHLRTGQLDLSTINHIYYPNHESFTNLFATAQHPVTFLADIKLNLLQPVSKIFKETQIIREFNNPIIL